MYNEAIRSIANSKSCIKWSVIISTLVIIGGLIPEITLYEFHVKPFDSLATILLGFSLMFFVISMKVNLNQIPNGQGKIVNIIPPDFSPLSKRCYWISILFFVLFFIRISFLTLRGF